MNWEQQLKLQAHLDGELPPGEAREISALLARDAEARALLAELQHTRAALEVFEAEIKLPETREFYWSKIERDLRRLEPPATADSPSVPVLVWLRRLLIPVAALSAVLLATLVTRHEFGLGHPFLGPETETAYADPNAFTYRDYASGTTLVWLSYPAEMEFADFPPADTLD